MMTITLAAAVCALLDAAAAAAITLRADGSPGHIVIANALLGAVIGVLTSVLFGVLIRRLQSLGYILAVALFLGMLLLLAWLVTSTQLIVAAATLALIIPLYALACIVTAVMVHPLHADR